ncbi:MAG: YkgJ family cysteine cluster protein, partial [Pseudobdellovibrionaceae bacterium]
PDCLFLKDKKCSIYEARPTQCRTWPFWPEVMPAKAWKKDVVSFCPGVGKGKLWSPEEIKSILQLQADSEQELITGE